ncbi:leucine-rich repeat domain-containing protein [uncultured Microscilla sp.]|uniref:leucine-rich repeat domain-containing protein n=1 Tax=uncultured Microscilla sp. TaxID=432653 RepID=UPI0026080DEA|nr:leucine-rich repeat domain-containing protein [uncultured Microscilla sp.]
MSELAKQLIEENLRTQNPYLDLGNCGLDGTEACLEQMKECVHLRELSFSQVWRDDSQNPVDQHSKNHGKANRLSKVPNGLPKGLNKLIISHNNGAGLSLDVLFKSLGVEDLTPLQHLANLKYLDLGYNRIKDLSPLSELRALKGLNVQNNHISDLTPLEGLTSLETLIVDSNEISELNPLFNLSKIQLLSINANALSDLTPLGYLKLLNDLRLGGNGLVNINPLRSLGLLEFLQISQNALGDLTPLQYLVRLQVLDVSRNRLNDLDSLANLSHLRSLNASDNQISSLHSLNNLTKLEQLHISYNHIEDLSPLADLPLINTLDIGNNKVSNLSFLRKLSQLYHLDVRGNAIIDLQGLCDLWQLHSLNLAYNQIEEIPSMLLQQLSKLKYLYLRKNPLINVPSQIFDHLDNCLPTLRTYFYDLAQGKTKVHQSKVILIGNGRTGKTCLVKRWLDETFDANEASTHAIQLRSQFLSALEQAQKLDHVQLNIWDFGGQDIYHSTHLLFMQTQAVFVLVWDAETEAQASQEETLADGSTVTYQNHPLTYWLDYAQALGAGSPILIVQTKKEQDGEQVPANWNALKARYNIVGHVSVDSALDDGYKNGFKNLQLELEKTIYAQIEKSCTDLPSSWWQVRQEIVKLQEDGQKTLSQDTYLQICEQFQLGESSQNTLRNYLHHTGFFFYRPEIFDNEIIIDQQWAIEAVYTLLDRQGMFMEYRGKGFFKGKDLNLVWNKRSLAEQELLVSFMESCEMCVEVSRYWGKLTGGFVPFEKREYLAPQLLPDEPIPNQADIFPVGVKGVYIKVKHAFLHTGIMQHFIVSYASQAARENIKKNCIYLHYAGQKVLIQALPAGNEILVRLATPDSDEVLSSFGEVLQSIRLELIAIGQSTTTGTQEMVSIDGKGYVAWNDLRNHSPENPKIRAYSGQCYDFAEFEVFLNREHRPFNHPLKGRYDFASFAELKELVEQALAYLDVKRFDEYFRVLDKYFFREIDKNLISAQLRYNYQCLKYEFISNDQIESKLRVFAQGLLS